MNNKILNLKKNLILSIFVIFAFFAVTAQAIFYAPGETLTPGCGPTDPDCGVVNSLVGGTSADSYLYYKSTSGTGTSTGIGHQFVGGTNGGTSILTMLNNGKVGIGTVDPQTKLEVVGDLDLNSATSFLKFGNDFKFTTTSTTEITVSDSTDTPILIFDEI